MRDGIDGKLLDWGKELEVPVRFLIEEWLELLDDVVDQLDTREEIEYVWTIHREGTSADRRLREYEETGSLNSVVDMLAEETLLGV